MRIMFGCATMLGVVFAVIGLLIGLLLATDVTIVERLCRGLLASGMVGGMAFVASLILMSQDMQLGKATHKKVRRMLLARDDQEEQDFLLHFPRALREIAAAVRSALAAYFDVPVTKIRASDSPRQDFFTPRLGPSFCMFVVGHVAEVQKAKLEQWTYRQDSEHEMVSFVREVRRIVRQGIQQEPSE